MKNVNSNQKKDIGESPVKPNKGEVEKESVERLKVEFSEKEEKLRSMIVSFKSELSRS